MFFFAGSDSLPWSTTSSQVQAVAAGDDVAVRPAARGVLGTFPWTYCMYAHVTELSVHVCQHDVKRPCV